MTENLSVENCNVIYLLQVNYGNAYGWHILALCISNRENEFQDKTFDKTGQNKILYTAMYTLGYMRTNQQTNKCFDVEIERDVLYGTVYHIVKSYTIGYSIGGMDYKRNGIRFELCSLRIVASYKCLYFF